MEKITLRQETQQLVRDMEHYVKNTGTQNVYYHRSLKLLKEWLEK